MSRVALITDVHWGARNDSLSFIEFYNSFYTNIFIPSLIKNKIDKVIMLGDIFDRRKYTNHVSLYHAKKIFFTPLKELGIKIYMIVGNHDTAYKNTNQVNSPSLLLKEYDNLMVIEEPTTINIDGIYICMLPWICSENHEASMNVIKNTSARICMGHLEICGFSMYRGMESHEGMSPEIFNKFDITFSGHYHHKSDNNKIFYLGNPYELTWQDYGDPRGFHFFNLKTNELQFILNPYTIFFRYEYDDVHNDVLKFDATQVKNKFVKIIVLNKKDLYKFDKFINSIYENSPLEVKIIEDFSEFNEGTVDESINLEDTSKVLDNYIDSIETELDKTKIKMFLKGLYTEALNQEVV